ncbi:trypsin-1-like [Liolophura sinensis]|uniref:trypsin-1-like n=1 Tax=Liolophura sinensis TaxID=3198878 RepID=UPI0031596142
MVASTAVKIATMIYIWFTVAFSAGLLEAATQCGQSAISPKFSRIVGGHVAVPGSWPWLVMLNEVGEQACGGALIHPYWVVTASHCFDENISRHASRWDAYVGKFHMSRRDSTEQKVRVRQILMHPSYDIDTTENDIALLLLEHPVQYNTHVSPICLPDGSKNRLRRGDVCVVAGWGETHGSSDGSVLNQVRLPLLGDDTCRRSDWYGSDYLPQTMLCFGYEHGGHDTCQGDSGGPLMCKIDGSYHMMGVTSWGVDCARPKQPGVYTDASLYTNWIKETMARHGHPF